MEVPISKITLSKSVKSKPPMASKTPRPVGGPGSVRG